MCIVKIMMVTVVKRLIMKEILNIMHKCYETEDIESKCMRKPCPKETSSIVKHAMQRKARKSLPRKC